MNETLIPDNDKFFEDMMIERNGYYSIDYNKLIAYFMTDCQKAKHGTTGLCDLDSYLMLRRLEWLLEEKRKRERSVK